MLEAWDLVPDSERTADGTATFILFCEDTVNEPSYFRSFNIPGKVKVNIVEGQLCSFKNIVKTLQYCEKEGLLDSTNGNYRIKEGTTKHIWSVFDRDTETEDSIQIDNEKDLQFTLSIQLASNAGIEVAWSNDVFELWILLHFENLQSGIWRHRNYVYERLTTVFKKLPNQPSSMIEITGKKDFNYKLHLKKRAFFIQFVLPYLVPGRDIAIQRALELENHFNASEKYHKRNPCTRVHHLVKSILSFSGQ